MEDQPIKRDVLAALIGRMLHAEARTDAPPENERGDWLYGGIGPTEFTEPDAHGWMAIVPPTARAWMPRALVFWQEVVRAGFPVSPTLAAHPAHSLARWPAIEKAVRAYVAPAPETTAK
jgi:hypothetical protein